MPGNQTLDLFLAVAETAATAPGTFASVPIRFGQVRIRSAFLACSAWSFGQNILTTGDFYGHPMDQCFHDLPTGIPEVFPEGAPGNAHHIGGHLLFHPLEIGQANRLQLFQGKGDDLEVAQRDPSWFEVGYWRFLFDPSRAFWPTGAH